MYYEEVNGTVIGEVLPIHAQIFTPSGSPFRNGKNFASEQDAKDWASVVRAKAIAEIGEHEAHLLGWDKQWELRLRT